MTTTQELIIVNEDGQVAEVVARPTTLLPILEGCYTLQVEERVRPPALSCALGDEVRQRVGVVRADFRVLRQIPAGVEPCIRIESASPPLFNIMIDRVKEWPRGQSVVGTVIFRIHEGVEQVIVIWFCRRRRRRRP